MVLDRVIVLDRVMLLESKVKKSKGPKAQKLEVAALNF